jgi:Ca2+-binding EF-hand superfamily protein
MGTSCSSSKTTGQSPLTHLSSGQLEELHQLTHLPVSEIVAHHRQFLKTSPDGRLTYEQFEHQLPTRSKSRAVFNMIDRDRSGQITFEEYLLSMVMFSEQSQPEHQLAAVFETYQALARSHLNEPSTGTHTQGLNRSDVEQLLQRIHVNLSPDELHELTDRYMTTDQNRNGYISKQEFISACMKNAQLMERLGHKGAMVNETKN